ncbi:hypothetical protein [Burkholderia cenocepacia]|nr:hypothetical protein [Burkholderia cenocepacia]MDI9686604.1 hypothetical protein [Burkholderia cenocepacia]
MTEAKVKALLKKWGGWQDGEHWRFPTVWQKEQFEKEFASTK